MAAWQCLRAPDQWLTARVEGWCAPRWIRGWMLAASRAGDGLLWTVVGLAVLVGGGARRWPAFGAAVVAAGLGIGGFEILKYGIRRRRPQVARACGAQPPRAPDRYSFPSGHTATAFAVAQPLMLAYPRMEPVLLFVAINIAASRILLGLHFLSDVLAGTALGWTAGYIASAWLMHRH